MAWLLPKVLCRVGSEATIPLRAEGEQASRQHDRADQRRGAVICAKFCGRNHDRTDVPALGRQYRMSRANRPNRSILIPLPALNRLGRVRTVDDARGLNPNVKRKRFQRFAASVLHVTITDIRREGRMRWAAGPSTYSWEWSKTARTSSAVSGSQASSRARVPRRRSAGRQRQSTKATSGQASSKAKVSVTARAVPGGQGARCAPPPGPSST